MLSHITFYTAATAAWLIVSFFDGEFMRTIYKDVMQISVFGPFFAHWYAFGLYLTFALDGGRVIDLVFLAVWFALTVVEEVIQLLMLPKVYEWAEDASILSNDVEED